MVDEAQIRHDEQAEINLRILVALYDDGPLELDGLAKKVLRPRARYTGPEDVRHALAALKGVWIVDGDCLFDLGGDTSKPADGEVIEIEFAPGTRQRLDEIAKPYSNTSGRCD